MAVNGKKKGNSFERLISENLSLWLTNGKEKRACWRSDTSGAAATHWAKKGEEQRYVTANSGDIKQIVDKGEYLTLDNFFKTYVVECKCYAKIDLYPPYNKVLTSWFDQLLREKETTGKKAVLILKANNKKSLFCHEPSDLKINAPIVGAIHYKDLVLYVRLFDEVVQINDLRESRESFGEPSGQPKQSSSV